MSPSDFWGEIFITKLNENFKHVLFTNTFLYLLVTFVAMFQSCFMRQFWPKMRTFTTLWADEVVSNIVFINLIEKFIIFGCYVILLLNIAFSTDTITNSHWWQNDNSPWKFHPGQWSKVGEIVEQSIIKYEIGIFRSDFNGKNRNTRYSVHTLYLIVYYSVHY